MITIFVLKNELLYLDLQYSNVSKRWRWNGKHSVDPEQIAPEGAICSGSKLCLGPLYLELSLHRL